jgi:hypothetical protein
MSVLERVRHQRTEQRQARRATAIGADLIPRAPVDDERYAGVDLAARGNDLKALRLGLARLAMRPDDLPSEFRAMAERIAGELREAGPEEIGRYATDVLYAYADVPCLSPVVETTMYLAWHLSCYPQPP